MGGGCVAGAFCALSTVPTKHRLSNNRSMTYGFIDLFPEAGRKTNIGVVTMPRVTSTVRGSLHRKFRVRALTLSSQVVVVGKVEIVVTRR